MLKNRKNSFGCYSFVRWLFSLLSFVCTFYFFHTVPLLSDAFFCIRKRMRYSPVLPNSESVFVITVVLIEFWFHFHYIFHHMIMMRFIRCVCACTVLHSQRFYAIDRVLCFVFIVPQCMFALCVNNKYVLNDEWISNERINDRTNDEKEKKLAAAAALRRK